MASRRPITRSILVIAALAALAAPALAQRYQRVPAIVARGGAADAAFEAKRALLFDLARGEKLEAFAPHMGRSFFWDRDFGGMFKADKPPLANFADAFGIGSDTLPEYRTANWRKLRRVLGAKVSSPRVGGPGQCLPATVKARDARHFAAQRRAAKADILFWGAVIGRDEPVLAEPRAAAATIASLSEEIVRVVEWSLPDKEDSRLAFVAVALPDGRKGYLDESAVQTLTGERLCLGRGADGGWIVTGHVGGGD